MLTEAGFLDDWEPIFSGLRALSGVAPIGILPLPNAIPTPLAAEIQQILFEARSINLLASWVTPYMVLEVPKPLEHYRSFR